MDMELYGTLRILRFHTDLRVVDRIRSVGYAEDSLQWITDNAEAKETDSQSDSTSDSE